MSPQMSCPDSRSLQALADGRLSEAELTAVAVHVDACARCQDALQLITSELGRVTPRDRETRPGIPPEDSNLLRAIDQLKLFPESPGRDSHDDDLILSVLSPSDRPNALGRLGPYDVMQVLGRGGMGTVFKAWDSSLNRYVAIKVIAPQLATSAGARKRFEREARAAAAVNHEHVVAIHAVDEIAGLPYIVMEYVPGVSLQERLDRTGPLKLEEILRIGLQTASGLAAAHAQGLIHRDIKPANILLENGVERVKITDFGLARMVDDASLTQSGVLAGTPQYMAPEQARGEAQDHRVDLFSLGSVLYACCTGRPPFRASTTMAVLRRVSDDQPRDIREMNPETPDWLCRIIQKLHAKEPADRFPSAAEVADLLSRHLAHLQHPQHSALPPPVSTPDGWKKARSPGKLWVGAASLLLMFTAGVIGAVMAAGSIRDFLGYCIPSLHEDDSRGVAGGHPDRVLLTDEKGEPITLDGESTWSHAQNLLQELERERESRLQAEQALAALQKKYEGLLNALKAQPSFFQPPQPPVPPAIRLGHATAASGLVSSFIHPSDIQCFVFSPDGKWLTTGARDGMIRTWDVSRCRESAPPFAYQHIDRSQLLTFSRQLSELKADQERMEEWVKKQKETDEKFRYVVQKVVEEHPRYRVHSRRVEKLQEELNNAAKDGSAAVARMQTQVDAARQELASLRTQLRTEIEKRIVPANPAFRTEVLSSALPSRVEIEAFEKSIRDQLGDRNVQIQAIVPIMPMVKLQTPSRSWKAHSDAVTSLAYVSNGLLLSGSADGELCGWHSSTGSERLRLRAHEGAILAVAAASDGGLAASVGTDQMLRIWDLDTGKETKSFRLGNAHAPHIAFTPDAKEVLALDEEYTVWRKRLDQSVDQLPAVVAGGRPGLPLTLCPCGQQVSFIGEPATLETFDIKRGVFRTLDKSVAQPVTTLCYSPDATRLALACGKGTIQVHTLVGESQVIEIRTGDEQISQLKFAPNGECLTAIGAKNRIWMLPIPGERNRKGP